MTLQSGPTLHAEMVRVLHETGQPLSAGELAKAITDAGTYAGQGGAPTARQMHARVGNYPNLFIRTADGIWLAGSVSASRPPARVARPAPSGRAREEWHWEGRVQSVLAEYLSREGWSIERLADTARGQTGVDILGRHGRRTLAIEVKGYPSLYYARGPRAGERKPTPPTQQASHWLAGALHATIVARARDVATEYAIALPDVKRYRDLVGEVDWALRRLGFGLYFVNQDGSVEQTLPRITVSDRSGPTNRLY